MLTVVMVPIPVPGCPLPLFRVPLSAEDTQMSVEPVGMSFTVNSPDVREIVPPGRTVQVVAAEALVTQAMAARTAARNATRLRPCRFLTGLMVLPAGVTGRRVRR